MSWQDAAALAVVAVAAALLARRVWAQFRSGETKGCGGGCTSCPSRADAAAAAPPSRGPLIDLRLAPPDPRPPDHPL